MSIVGRDSELSQLISVSEQARSGRGTLVLVIGEAGIGKTALCEQASLIAAGADMAVAWAGCGQPAPTFWPWRQVLPELAAMTGHPRGDAELLAVSHQGPLLPAETEGSAGERVLQFESVVMLLRRCAAIRPLFVILDDLHAADTPSLRLLEFLAPQLRSLPAVVLATCREEDADAIRATLNALRPHARILAVPGLDATGVGALIAELSGNTPTLSTAEAVRRHTAGNPLFARELLRFLRDEGGSLAVLDRDGILPPVPDSVREVLARRIDQLTDECRQAIVGASAVGDEPSLWVLDAVTGVGRGRLLRLLDEAVSARVLREIGPGRYAFGHPLVRAAAYASIGIVHRVQLHRKIGEVLEAGPDGDHDLDALAHHFLAAAPGGTAGKAYRYAVAAARSAMKVLAYENAVLRYEQALTAIDLDASAGDRTAALIGLGEACAASGDPTGARDAYLAAAERARAAGDTSRLAEAALGLARGHGFDVPLFDQTQIDLLEEVLSQLDPAENPALCIMVGARLSVALSLTGSVDRRRRLSVDAVRLARSLGNEAVLAYALAAHCDAIAGPGDTERRLAESTEVISLATARADHHVELLGRRLHLLALLETGELAGAEADAVAYARTAAVLRQPVYDWCVPLWRGMRALMHGRFAECEECVAEVRRIGAQAGSRNADIQAGDQEFFLLLTTGRAADALALLESVVADIAEFGTQIQVVLAYGLARAGHLDEAAAHLDRLTRGPLAELPADSEWLAVLAQVAETVQAIGAHPVAGWVYQQLLPHRARFVVEGIGAVFRGSVEHYLGLLASVLGEPGKATEHATRAEAAHRRIGLSRTVEPETRAPTGNMFRREGEIWVLGYAGRVVRLRHAKGLADLAQLLAQPGREVPALDLAVPVAAAAGAIPEPELHAPGDLGDVLDGQARAAYKRRLAELEDELADADFDANPVWAERARAERDALVDQLVGAYGLAGRPRRAGDPAERARTAVTARLRAALTRIEAAHPELGRHLRHSVRTGTLCVYAPEEPTPWHL